MDRPWQAQYRNVPAVEDDVEAMARLEVEVKRTVWRGTALSVLVSVLASVTVLCALSQSHQLLQQLLAMPTVAHTEATEGSIIDAGPAEATTTALEAGPADVETSTALIDAGPPAVTGESPGEAQMPHDSGSVAAAPAVPVAAPAPAAPATAAGGTSDVQGMDDLDVLLHYLVDPPEAECQQPLTTLGPEHDDGGWTLCFHPRPVPPCLAISVGVGALPQFDVTMASDYGCEVHSYDPTIEPESLAVKDIQREGGHYHHVGLGTGASTSDFETQSLPQMLQSASPVHKGVAQVVKVDCEGCEWDAFEGVPGALDGVQQLAFELHMWKSHGFSIPKAASMFRHLHSSGFRFVYRNFNPWSLAGDGLKPLLDRLVERDGEAKASQHRHTADNMIRWAKEAGYGFPSDQQDLWKHQVGGHDAHPCCYELTFVRAPAS